MLNCLLQNPTIKRLRRHLEIINSIQETLPKSHESKKYFTDFQKRHLSNICQEDDIPQHEVEAVYPCTASQEGMLSQFLHSNGLLYLNYILLRVHEGIDIYKLTDAWRSVLLSNEIFRSGFVPISDKTHHFAMIIHKAESFQIPLNTIHSDEDL